MNGPVAPLKVETPDMAGTTRPLAVDEPLTAAPTIGLVEGRSLHRGRAGSNDQVGGGLWSHMLYGHMTAALLLAPLLVPGVTMRHLMLIILGLSVVLYLLVLPLALVRSMVSRTRRAGSGRTIRR